MKKKIVASIEARMGSSRCAGKVLKDINGTSMLGRICERLRSCQLVDTVVVATSTSGKDDPIEQWCRENNVLFYRGSEHDVLKRVVDCHTSVGSDVVVEITGDCPMTDPELVDEGIETYLANDVDVVTNCGRILTWPMGIYVQVFSLDLLKDVEISVKDPAVREHVSLYFYENPSRYTLYDLIAPTDLREPSWRCQVDYPEDFLFQEKVFSYLIKYARNTKFGLDHSFKKIKN